MIGALSADLVRVPECRVSALRDPRVLQLVLPQCEVVDVLSRSSHREVFARLAATADARRLYVPCMDGAVYECDPAAGKVTPLPDRHASYASGCVMLPGDQTLVSAGYDADEQRMTTAAVTGNSDPHLSGDGSTVIWRASGAGQVPFFANETTRFLQQVLWRKVGDDSRTRRVAASISARFGRRWLAINVWLTTKR